MASGNVDKAKGRLKDAGGALTDDESLRAEGKVDKASGSTKNAVGKAADKVKDAVNPKRRGRRRPTRGPGGETLGVIRPLKRAAAWPDRPARRRRTSRRRRSRTRSPRAP